MTSPGRCMCLPGFLVSSHAEEEKVQDDNTKEAWFGQCMSLGWTRIENKGQDRVKSPRGTVISFSERNGRYYCGMLSSTSFRKLVSCVQAMIGDSCHVQREKIQSLKLNIKELRDLVESDESWKHTLIDDWKETDDGYHLDYVYGPLEVSATISKDFSWRVSMIDGGPCDKEKEGSAKGFAHARCEVQNALLEWSEEVMETGRYAAKLSAKLRGLVE